MYKKIILILAFLFTNSAYSLDFCPDEEARQEGGYLKVVEVCDYETTQTNLRTQCYYNGKLWGEQLGGVIFSETTSYSGHSTCNSSIFVREQNICRYIDPTPNTPNPPGTMEPPVLVCENYGGDIPLRSQNYLFDTVSQEIPGSCRNSREWVRCKP
ncbi:MAG: hypothetical protein ACI9LM_000563 [Alteromonadaceae bacterium]|jgi:hypothetical protein